MKTIQIIEGNIMQKISSNTSRIPNTAKSYILLPFLLLTIILSLSSCAKTNLAKPIVKFSELTAETTTFTQTGIETVRVVDLKKSAVRASKKDKLKEKDFEPILPTEDLEARFTALQMLDAYVGALSKIATIDKSEDIKKVAENFQGKVKGIFSAVGAEDKFSEKAGSVSSKIVNFFLKAVVDKKKEEAIKDALTSTDSSINELCELIASEFQINGPFFDQVEFSYNSLQTSVNDMFKNAKKDSVKLKLALEYGELVQKKEEILIFFKAIARSYYKISEAHHALMLQATTGASSQIALGSLSDQISIAKIYYDLVLSK